MARLEEMGPDFPKFDPDGEPLHRGDLVGVSVEDMDSSPYGVCYHCATGFPVLCANRVPRNEQTLKKGRQRSWGKFRFTPGVEAVYKLPDDISFESAVLAEPLSMAAAPFRELQRVLRGCIKEWVLERPLLFRAPGLLEFS